MTHLFAGIGATLLFSYAKATFTPVWWLYALIWWGMFVFGEIGQWLEGKYSGKEAIAGPGVFAWLYGP